MDLAALQEKINNYITVVSSWVRNVSALYFSGTPQNVTVDMIDDNGNLTTSTLPNVAQFRKTVWDDVGGALGQLEKSFYVDALNGNDLNSGTSAAPFKTLKKAVDSCPKTARALIRIIGDYTFTIDEGNVDYSYKIITIHIPQKFEVLAGVSGTDARYPKIATNGLGHLSFFLENLDDTTTTPAQIILRNTTGLVLASGYTGFIEIGVYFVGNTAVTINYYVKLVGQDVLLIEDGNLFNYIAGNSARSANLNFNISGYYTGNLRFVGGSGLLNIDTAGTASLLFKLNGQGIVDENDVALTWSDVVTGVVTDVNGVPRNITSNIVF